MHGRFAHVDKELFFFVFHPHIGPEPNGRAGAKKNMRRGVHARACECVCVCVCGRVACVYGRCVHACVEGVLRACNVVVCASVGECCMRVRSLCARVCAGVLRSRKIVVCSCVGGVLRACKGVVCARVRSLCARERVGCQSSTMTR